MQWNWQQADWKSFSYNEALIKPFEQKFLHKSGVLFGAFLHLENASKNEVTIEIIGNEALKTSEIEGEYLNRESLQSSIRNHFFFTKDNLKIPPAEQGIAKMMIDLYRSYQQPLSNKLFFSWHKLLLSEKKGLNIGDYRTHKEPMQVVSGGVHAPRIHFEAPPSEKVPDEMEQFIAWFNKTTPNGKTPLSPLIRAGIAHLYFVTIHPFEDGNGRIGRAIAEKSLAQNLGQPTLLALSYIIEKDRKSYYNALEITNKSNEITDWLVYFSNLVIAAQEETEKRVRFIIEKAKIYNKLAGLLNERQEKVMAKIFNAGHQGFIGGLSAENYIKIAKTTRSTATRDLHDLVAKGALVKTGELKYTRYNLNLNNY